MAAPLKTLLRWSSVVLKQDVFRRQISCTACLDKSWKPKVCESPDKSMMMCWHPEPEFPYEHTQSLPRDKSELTKGESVLKVQYLLDDKLKNRPEGPTDEELSKLFHTTKVAWRPRPRYEKRVKMREFTPVDRKGL